MERIDCKIADLLVRLEADGRTARQAEPYRVSACPGPLDMVVTCDPGRIMETNGWIEDPDMARYMGTGASFARQLPGFSGFQLHASAVELDGRAYLFSGPCGVGKSTMTGRWGRLFRAAYINDDKPVLRRLEQGWMAYGTPWSGKTDLSRPGGVPAGALIFLRRGTENRMEPLVPAQALPLFLSQTPRTMGQEGLERLLTLADRFLKEVPVWRLTCMDNDEAAVLAKHTLCRG